MRTCSAPRIPAFGLFYDRHVRALLVDFQRRGRVDARMRRSLAIERRPVSADDAHMIRLLADDTASVLLAELPADQRDAIAGYVVGDRGYADLAGELGTSEAAVRQRVSRGLATLRRRMGGAR